VGAAFFFRSILLSIPFDQNAYREYRKDHTNRPGLRNDVFPEVPGVRIAEATTEHLFCAIKMYPMEPIK